MPLSALEQPRTGPFRPPRAASAGLSAEEFEGVMRQHNQRLFRIARSILRDDAEAEDIVQNAYVSAYTHLDQYAGDAPIGGWLARITTNGALDRLRQRKRDQRLLNPAMEASESWRTGASTPTDRSPEDGAAQAELRKLLEQAIDQLPDPLRLVLVLRDVEGMSGAETGECLGIEEGAVRVRLHRARGQLRRWLGRRAVQEEARPFAFAGERCDRIVRGVLLRLGLFELS